jgi:hypothetical protein
MKMKFGAIVTDGRGKIGGHVASKNRGGAYLRTKVTPANGQTSAQNAVRASFTTLSQAWRGLTDAQRDSWNAAVADFSRTNIFGDLINPSGVNLFQRLNNNLLSIGEAMISVPPLPASVGAAVLTSATNAIGLATMTLVFAGPVPANTTAKIFATAPLSAGKSYVKSEFRQIGTMPAAEASPFNVKAMYLAKFGSQGAIGQKIFFKLLPINATTGQAGAASSVSVIALA